MTVAVREWKTRRIEKKIRRTHQSKDIARIRKIVTINSTRIINARGSIK